MGCREIGVHCFCCNRPLTEGERLYSVSYLSQELEFHPKQTIYTSIGGCEGLFTACDDCKRLKRLPNAVNRLLTDNLLGVREWSDKQGGSGGGVEPLSCELCGEAISFGSQFVTIDCTEEVWNIRSGITVLQSNMAICACVSCSSERDLRAVAAELVDALADGRSVVNGARG